METPEHQDWRARQTINYGAALKVGLGMGLFLFIFSGGTPWTGAGTANAAMGRVLPWPWPAIALLHFSMTICYMLVIAKLVYRFRLLPALLVGVMTAGGLYLVNLAFFATTGLASDLSNGRSVVAHVILGLLGSAAYKGISVPPPDVGIMHPDSSSDDPEPPATDHIPAQNRINSI